jgi:hypothetical protein
LLLDGTAIVLFMALSWCTPAVPVRVLVACRRVRTGAVGPTGTGSLQVDRLDAFSILKSKSVNTGKLKITIPTMIDSFDAWY